MRLKSILLIATISVCLPAAAECTPQPDGTSACSERRPVGHYCAPGYVWDLETRQCRKPTAAETDPGAEGACTCALCTRTRIHRARGCVRLAAVVMKRFSVRQLQAIDPRYRDLVFALLVGVGYWLFASYSLALPVRSSGISYVWPADGLALGALLCSRRRSWPAYLLAVFLGNAFASNKPLALNLLYSSFNAFEPWLVAAVVTKVLGVRPAIGSMVGAFRFLSLTMAVMAVAILVANTVDWALHHGDFWTTWYIWYLSNTVGMLILAPLLVAVSRHARESLGPWSRLRFLEAAALILGLVVVAYFTFSVSGEPWLGLVNTPMMRPALFLIWAAIRFALPGGTLAMAILAMIAFWYTAHGLGPIAIANHELNKALIHLQLSLMVVAIVVILVSAIATEWRHALAESRATRKKLDRALESARLALFEVDVRTRNVYVSEGWGEMTGAPRGETYATIAELLSSSIRRTAMPCGSWDSRRYPATRTATRWSTVCSAATGVGSGS